MTTIGTTTSLEDDTRQLGLEFLVTLAETRPALARKQAKFIENTLSLVLSMMLEVEEDQFWETAVTNDEVDITNADVAEESLDRLALALGGKQIVPILFSPPMLPALFQNPSWKHRFTALMAVSVIGEGCNVALIDHLTEVVKNILPYLRDPHARVRWAACNSLGQMSTDFGPDFQTRFIADVLPGLLAVMDDPSMRVQAHAAAALINFCEMATKELLEPYLDAVLGKLLNLLKGGQTRVQEQAITAIAAVADCAESHFGKYYDSFVPLLKSILTGAHAKEHRMMRGKAMECITLIGVAVGKERFAQDAKEVMEVMIHTQRAPEAEGESADDPQQTYIQPSFARICKCLEKDFVPYLPHVMPALLAGARLKPDVTVNDVDEDESGEREGWEYIQLGEKQIGIHTSSLEEKYNACNTVYKYASELGEGFSPYVEEVSKIMVPLLRFYYHDGVRAVAAQTIPHLVASSAEYLKNNAPKGADKTYVRNLASYVLPEFIESLKKEPEKEVLVQSLESFAETLANFGTEVLSSDQIKTVSDLCLTLLQDVMKRRTERKNKKKEEDHDEEEEERIEWEENVDEDIMLMVSEVVMAVTKNHGGNALPHLQSMMPIVLQMLHNKGNPAADRQSALCIFDELVEHGGQPARVLFQHVIPSLIEYIMDKEASVSQAAVFGAGVCAQFGGDEIKSAIPEIVSRLALMINQPDSRSDVKVNPTENAIGAFAKCIYFQSSCLDVNLCMNQLLQWLPVVEDKIESKVTYAQVCTFLESDHFRPVLLGSSYQNLPKLLAVFGAVLETDAVTPEISARIRDILRLMQATIPQQMQAAFPSLQPESQARLMRLVQA